MVTWQKLDAATFCDLVTEFLSLHPNLEPSNKEDSTEIKNGKKQESVAKRKKSTDTHSILDADEDDQLAAAIAASLKETSKQTLKAPDDSDFSDSDSDSDLIEGFSADNSNSGPMPASSSHTTENITKVQPEKEDAVTNCPRRILTDLDTKQTLKDLGLFPKEMVIVQQ